MKAVALKYLASGALCALSLCAAPPAFAHDPQPQGYREKPPYEFGDVQRRASQPAPQNANTPTNPFQMFGDKSKTRPHYPMPTGYRAKQRHVFRDVQLGFGAPVPDDGITSPSRTQAANDKPKLKVTRAKPRQEPGSVQSVSNQPARSGTKEAMR